LNLDNAASRRILKRQYHDVVFQNKERLTTKQIKELNKQE